MDVWTGPEGRSSGESMLDTWHRGPSGSITRPYTLDILTLWVGRRGVKWKVEVAWMTKCSRIDLPPKLEPKSKSYFVLTWAGLVFYMSQGRVRSRGEELRGSRCCAICLLAIQALEILGQ